MRSLSEAYRLVKESQATAEASEEPKQHQSHMLDIADQLESLAKQIREEYQKGSQ